MKSGEEYEDFCIGDVDDGLFDNVKLAIIIILAIVAFPFAWVYDKVTDMFRKEPR